MWVNPDMPKERQIELSRLGSQVDKMLRQFPQWSIADNRAGVDVWAPDAVGVTVQYSCKSTRYADTRESKFMEQMRHLVEYRRVLRSNGFQVEFHRGQIRPWLIVIGRADTTSEEE